ncbi:hypothetical protein [Silanimonas sp.]|uniref:sulfotransferase family protein n=1 Tax=Silanimonas sp. TaxID=1929290 RepID=UPI0022C1FEEC|nr:hypothetical protein [Silanimonas sp.]MCZ8062011.1 hypothetical protein [Silanimonas sp.]
MNTTERPTALVVLGMHRSGTSAVAGALVARGAHAGNALLPSTSDNANGYFEDARLVAASDALLASAGLTWDEPGPLSRPIVAPEAQAAMVEVFCALRGRSTPAVVKDPRACRLVPEWSQAMAEAGLRPAYLIVLRDPREVAASLQARDGMSAYRAGRLWLEHLLEAELATRGAARVFIDFQDLVQAPDATLDTALGVLGLGDVLRPDVARGTGVDARLRRQRAEGGEGEVFAERVYAFAKGCLGTAGDGAVVAAAFDAFRVRWLEDAESARAALLDARAREGREREDALRLLREVRNGLALADAWEKAPSRAPNPRVYWRALDAAHSEDRSFAARAQADGGFVATVGGPGIGVDRLRLDPDDRAGVFEITALVVAGVPVTDLPAAVVACNGVVRPTAGGLLLVATDDDPWIEIALGSMAPAGTSVPVRFDLRGRGLPELLWSLVEQEAIGATRLRELEALTQDLAERRAADAAAAQAEAAVVLDALDRLARQSAEILGWTRRRTFRYWWRRWRGKVETPEGTP